jgi:hypothetical protein
MRNRYTRTITAPTQCADLESGSSQYFSKTSPTGLSFTDDFTCMGWVKLESYGAQQGIIGRRNADTEGWSLGIRDDGRVQIIGLRIAGNNYQHNSYQSIPLNKWVHVAASLDMSGTSGLIYIDGVLVPSTGTPTGTATALVQGTTALVVGNDKSAGTNPFDGKIAQAAVFSSVLSASTIRSYMSQTLTGSESTLVSAYSFNNVITDLNTSNANDLTAQGSALATNADTPFTQSVVGTSVTAGTTNYSETYSISSDGLTETVIVSENNTIPTTGGVSAMAYSTAVTPYGYSPSINTDVTAISNPYKFSAYIAATQTLTDGVYTKVNFNTERFDTNSNFDSTTNYRYTAPVNGFYQISTTLSINGTAGTLAASIAMIYKNGVAILNDTSYPNNGLGQSANQNHTLSQLIQLSASDYLEIFAYADVTSSTGNITAGAAGAIFSGFLVSQT